MTLKKLLLIALYTWIVTFASFFGNRVTMARAIMDSANENLVQQFKNPHQSAWPRVFWWWLEGNVTKEGITRDLEAMKAKGIGGALIFDAGSSNYQVAKLTPAGPVFLSSEWRELYKHALKEANRLGIEISLSIQSGWNLGGPSVQPENAMKKFVWSEKRVKGPVKLSEVLPVSSQVREGFYRDIAVQAYKLAAGKEREHRPIKDWGIKSVNDQFRGWGAYPLYILREQFPSIPGEEDVKSDAILDITDKMDKNGRINWDVPEGTWLILRYGYTLTGAKVSTSSPGWKGLSLDYLSTRALDFYFETVVDTLIADAGDMAGKTLKYLHTDSWEMGPVNWTAEFREEFKKWRGYDPTPFLPVLAKKIVDSRKVSNRFLYDLRRTISDCIADNHYKKFADYSHRYGIGIHPESGGPHSAPIDALQCLGRNDIPMGEFWARAKTHRIKDEDRLFGKQPATAAHIYGKKLVNAEGFTTIGPQWEKDPWDLKPTADREFCEGINRIFFHQFTASQPGSGKPGNEYFAGTHFNPNITWWEQAGAFNDYLSRSQFLLQQGLFVADVCYYYGDDVPNFVPLKHVDPSLGSGYDYDVTNTEVILTRMSVKDGRIVLPDGMSYRLLVLPERKAMRLDVLRKISELVRAGATVVGPKPFRTPGLRDYPGCDQEVKELADTLWGPCDGKTVKQHAYGKGRIFWGKSLREILLSDGVKPDFEFSSTQEGSLLDYIHRSSEDAEIYFVANRKDRWQEAECRFRVIGKVPELWSPDTGEMNRQVLYDIKDGVTKVPLRLAPFGSKFVVFRKASEQDHIVSLVRNGQMVLPVSQENAGDLPVAELVSGKDKTIELRAWQPGSYEIENSLGKVAKIDIGSIPQRQSLLGSWEIRFPRGWGAPESVVFDSLKSWTKDSEPGVKYFSGTACYRKEFDVPGKMLEKGKYFYLDLGEVKNIAEVSLNGKSLGILWKKPFRVDITDAIKAGKNELEVKITNLWPNRLIGDQFLPEDQRYTHTNIQKFTRDSPLMRSGLLGPVRILAAQVVEVRL